MIYQALKIEIRHGSADDHFAVVLLIVPFDRRLCKSPGQIPKISTKEKKIANQKRLYQAQHKQRILFSVPSSALINP